MRRPHHYTVLAIARRHPKMFQRLSHRLLPQTRS